MTNWWEYFVTVWNLENTAMKDFEAASYSNRKGCDRLMTSAMEIGRTKSTLARHVSCLESHLFFTLAIWGREFLVLISCPSCHIGAGYLKVKLPGASVKKCIFLLLTEIFLFLLLQKLNWSSFNYPNGYKYSLVLLDPSRITKILKESSVLLQLCEQKKVPSHLWSPWQWKTFVYS